MVERFHGILWPSRSKVSVVTAGCVPADDPKLRVHVGGCQISFYILEILSLGVLEVLHRQRAPAVLGAKGTASHEAARCPYRTSYGSVSLGLALYLLPGHKEFSLLRSKWDWDG